MKLRRIGLSTLSRKLGEIPFWYVVEDTKDNRYRSGIITGNLDNMTDGNMVEGCTDELWYDMFGEIIIPMSYLNACKLMLKYINISKKSEEILVLKPDTLCDFSGIKLSLEKYILENDSRFKPLPGDWSTALSE